MNPRRDDPQAPLDERVRDAERAVVLQDRLLQQAFDDLTQQTRHVARNGGRTLLAAAGAGLAGWIAWRLTHRRPAHARRAARERDDERRYDGRRARDDAPRSAWHKLFNTALLVAPFVMPAGARATGAVDALAPGRGWPRRLLRLLRAAIAWNGRRGDAKAGAGVSAAPPPSRRATPPTPR